MHICKHIIHSPNICGKEFCLQDIKGIKSYCRDSTKHTRHQDVLPSFMNKPQDENCETRYHHAACCNTYTMHAFHVTFPTAKNTYRINKK